MAVAATVLAVLGVELAGRLAGVDFDFKARTFQRLPPFYRVPTVPPGPFFRRPGPERWHGKVIETWVAAWAIDMDPDPYRNESAITVEYDRDGFRNPASLGDWVIVVAGDSFTELGYLPDEDLFTTRLARHLRCPVKNLGVSYTGPLTQTMYLTTYGRSPSAREAILVFFEGNDVSDLQRERARVELARREPPSSRPLFADLPPQSSFVTAVYRWLATRNGSHATLPPTLARAEFATAEGRTAVTVERSPPRGESLPPPVIAALDEAIGGWGAAARTLGLRPWLAFMPTKRHVLEGRLVPAPGQPSLPPVSEDLRALVRDAASARDVSFIDLLPALRRETDAGRLTYNPILDAHLNRRGARVVARALATSLGRAMPRGERSRPAAAPAGQDDAGGHERRSRHDGAQHETRRTIAKLRAG